MLKLLESLHLVLDHGSIEGYNTAPERKVLGFSAFMGCWLVAALLLPAARGGMLLFLHLHGVGM